LGSGQVGTYAARAIAENGRETVAADLEPAIGYFSRFGPKNDCPLEEVDVQDQAAVAALIRAYDVDTIILSFGLDGAACARDPERARQINVSGPQKVAEVARDASVKRIVFVSSFAVYGRQAISQLKETATPAPESIYGRTKVAAEEILTQFRAFGIDIRILRPCGVFGPVRYGHGSHSSQLVESLLIGGLHDKELILRNSSVSADEYLYIKDLGRAIAAAAVIEEALPHFTFNIGTGSKVTAEELCNAVRQVAPNLRVRIETTEPEHERGMPPLDTRRAHRFLGLAPNYGLVDALIDYATEAGLIR
jgi:nucleoside-diphosphate-sugar epimerase